MADIAFLLLIFFLVTTTISADKGILRKLPSDCPPNEECTSKIPERNVLRISLNDKQEIMIEDEVVELNEVHKLVKQFVDNNGQSNCNYCQGNQLPESSDHSKDAVISLSYDALTTYQLFISVQDQITKAYYSLRERYTRNAFQKELNQITKDELQTLRKVYPFKVSEVMVR